MSSKEGYDLVAKVQTILRVDISEPLVDRLVELDETTEEFHLALNMASLRELEAAMSHDGGRKDTVIKVRHRELLNRC